MYYKRAAGSGHGTGYLHAHDYPMHYARQQYLPDTLAGTKFYEPTDIGYEKNVSEHMKRLEELS